MTTLSILLHALCQPMPVGKVLGAVAVVFGGAAVVLKLLQGI